MTKFKCIKSIMGCSTSVGDILVGKLVHTKDGQYIELSKDSDRTVFGEPRWNAGDRVPLNGYLFKWEEVK